MLPFTSIDFFVLFGVFLLFAFVSKRFFSSFLSYRNFLLLIAVLFILVFYPRPFHPFLFAVYSYSVYLVFRNTHKLTGSLLLALPMILVKAAFYTDLIAFAGMSYITFRVIQVLLDNDPAQRPVPVFDYLLFMIFPATLLIGPIDHFQRFKGDLDEGYKRLSGDHVLEGWQMMLYGIMQKFILAELVNRYWLSHADASSKEIGDMTNNMYAYSVYLYFDFAGYSALAAGLSRTFGIAVPENFNAPYLAVNPQDFWRRWHITLSEWLRDYFFRPYYKWLSGMKRLKNYPLLKQNSGLFLTFLIMGLWNGFQGIYLISGSIFGFYSVVHNTYLVQCRKKQRDVVFGDLSPAIVKVISIFLMFNLSCFALYVFSGRCPY
jgi:membrane protein involved in D-alanine export